MRRLVDREGERARIAAVLEEALAGGSAALVLHGEAGIGKTALLRHADARAAACGMRVVRARGIETESDIPFAGLSELLAPLLCEPGLDVIPGVQARALAAALALEPGAPRDRFTVAAALLSLLAAAAEPAPVLVVVDDAQWLDDASLEALLFAGRRLGREGVAMLGAVRDGVELRRPIPEWVPRLHVGPLPGAAARELLAGAVAEPVAERLVATAAGNPLALLEMPGLLSDAQRAGREPIADPMPAGATVEASFRRRIDALPEPSRRALVVAAAAGSARAETVVAGLRALGLDVDALEAAEGAGVVALSSGAIEFRHPLMRSTAYHAVSPGERRAAHRALAQALAAGSPARAWHLSAACVAPDEEVAAALEGAGRDARERGAHATAARELARAAELTPDDDARARRLVEAAADASLVGDGARAATLLDDARRRTCDPVVLADLRRLQGHVEMRRGNPLAAHDLLVSEAERVVGRDPRRAAGLFLEASVCHMMTGDMRALVASADRARTLATGLDPAVELLATAVIGEAYLALGEVRAGEDLLSRVAPYLLAGDPLAVVEVVAMAGHASIWVEKLDRAEWILGELVARGREAGALGALVYPLAAHAQLDLRAGRWAPAYAHAAESVELAEQVEADALLAVSLSTLAQVEAGLGHEEAARTHAARALELLADRRGHATSMYAVGALGHLELSLGRIPEAIAHLEQAARTEAQIGARNPAIVLWRSDLIEAYARAGREADALEQVEALERLATRTGQALARVTALRGRALLADDAGFRNAFERTLTAHDELPMPFERARTLLAYGERLRRAKHRADARGPLRQALEGFERLGARQWAERARAELRATGQGAGRRTEAAAEQLTPHELQVAILVAQGMTNREAAAALFLSPKTIEYHLGQIYRKLDVRSRTQLARLIAMEGADATVDGARVPALAG